MHSDLVLCCHSVVFRQSTVDIDSARTLHIISLSLSSSFSQLQGPVIAFDLLRGERVACGCTLTLTVSRSIPTVHPCSQSGRRLWVAKDYTYMSPITKGMAGPFTTSTQLRGTALRTNPESFFSFANLPTLSSCPNFQIYLIPFYGLLNFLFFFSYFSSFRH